LSVAYGKTMYDLLRLRKGIVENIPDAVLYPSSEEEIVKIVAYCDQERIPLYVFGGGSSVTRGPECMRGGISLDMKKNFNKVVKFNEIDQTITVEAGMSGPKLEETLNKAPELFGAKERYTCGHFPQSFEYSVVGGWVVTRGAGQNSTYYGKIEDIVLGQTYVTPVGIIKTDSYPAKATGPSVDQIMMGSEGTFGVLTHVTLKIFKYRPENHLRFSFMFKDWQSAQKAAREIMQEECGKPSVFRFSDPEETDVMMRLYGIQETPLNTYLKLKGYKENKKCLMLGYTDGEKGFCKNVFKNVKKICKRNGGLWLTGFPAKAWEKGRFTDPYLRDTLQDFGVMIDTLECTVNWSNMNQVYEDVRAYCKSRPQTICMTHISHAYPQGANLYFIFVARMTELDEFKNYHSGILDAIQKSGATMSHHHGIGKMFAPWLEGQIGHNQIQIFKALKKHFDPHNIMNPGGTLGLDLEDKDKRFLRKPW
ncbi:MAG TPA: FAD-binding oxidoreductase, partial [Bacilli bacterium]